MYKRQGQPDPWTTLRPTRSQSEPPASVVISTVSKIHLTSHNLLLILSPASWFRNDGSVRLEDGVTDPVLTSTKTVPSSEAATDRLTGGGRRLLLEDILRARRARSQQVGIY